MGCQARLDSEMIPVPLQVKSLVKIAVGNRSGLQIENAELTTQVNVLKSKIEAAEIKAECHADSPLKQTQPLIVNIQSESLLGA